MEKNQSSDQPNNLSPRRFEWQAPASSPLNWKNHLLIGLLSMFYAEVYAGSSQLWFLDFWGLCVTFPLYLLHTIFYLNCAIRTKRTSIPQLYFWGTLFGLYEAPITKVLWNGYPGTITPAWGLVGGIAINEYLTLVFFWHPLLAFILPILTFEIFANSLKGSENPSFTSHRSLLEWNSSSKWLYFGITFLGSLMLTFNTQFTGVIAVLAAGGSIILVLIAKSIASTNPTHFSIYDFKLSDRGFGIVIIFFLGLYGIMWGFLSPEKIPDAIAFLPIIASVLIFLLILKVSKPFDEKSSPKSAPNGSPITTNDQIKIWLGFIGLLIIWALISQITLIIGTLIFVGISFIGAGLFIIMLIQIFKTQKLTLIQPENKSKGDELPNESI
jgi:hypothetical protein